MRRLFFRILLFSIPVLLFFIPPVMILRVTGESYLNLNSFLGSKVPYLLGYAYNEDNYRYLKWKEINQRERQTMIALGSSRVLQFRQDMFAVPFYNAGYTVSGIADFIPFLSAIPAQKYPDVLLIGLDQWMFNSNWDKVIPEKRKSTGYWEDSYSYYPSTKTFLRVWKDLLGGKYGLEVLQSSGRGTSIRRVGLNAIVNSKGIRSDGSMQYGDQVTKLLLHDSTANDYGFKDSFRRVSKGNRRFEFGDTVNPSALRELDTLLSFCRSRGIQVIGFIPPFAPAVNEAIGAGNKHAYLELIVPLTAPIFRQYGFELWDLSVPESYQSSNTEMLDGFHGSELTYTRMILFMAGNGSEIVRYTDPGRLGADIIKRKNSLEVYSYSAE